MGEWPYECKEFIVTVFYGKHVWETRCERDHATTVYHTFTANRMAELSDIIEIRGVDTAGTPEKFSIPLTEITAMSIAPALEKTET